MRRMDDFSRLSEFVGERLALKANTLELSAELTEFKRVGTGESSAFSVLLETDQKEPVPQQIFHVSGEGLEEVALFLVPIGPGEKGMVYEAIINSPPAATP